MKRTLNELRIVFMGTPDFAVASLDALVQAGANIVGVVTAPDKPAGRGFKLTESAVKKYALSKGLSILQPPKLKDPDFLHQLEALKADLQIVVAFRMLPEIVWNMPPMGTVNLHGSLLPQYRGAAPIHWAVINGEETTGVTTFQLKHEIDTGNILLQEKISISENETTGELYNRLMNIGAALLVKTVKQLAEGSLVPISQQSITHTDATLKHAPKIFTDTCRIHFNRSTQEVHNLIRGLSPIPGAFTMLEGKTLKIFKAIKENQIPDIAPGHFKTDGKTYLKFACSDGYIAIQELQLEGKKRIGIEEFLRGYRFQHLTN